MTDQYDELTKKELADWARTKNRPVRQERKGSDLVAFEYCPACEQYVWATGDNGNWECDTCETMTEDRYPFLDEGEIQWPEKASVKLIVERLDIEFRRSIKHVEVIPLSELERVVDDHARKIRKLASTDAIDTYLYHYRGLSLQDWLNSL